MAMPAAFHPGAVSSWPERAPVPVGDLGVRLGPQVVVPARRARLPEVGADDRDIAAERLPAAIPASVTWPRLIRSTNLSAWGMDLANSQAPDREDEMYHTARWTALATASS
jgi:hypothetical protein